MLQCCSAWSPDITEMGKIVWMPLGRIYALRKRERASFVDTKIKDALAQLMNRIMTLLYCIQISFIIIKRRLCIMNYCFFIRKEHSMSVLHEALTQGRFCYDECSLKCIRKGTFLRTMMHAVYQEFLKRCIAWSHYALISTKFKERAQRNFIGNQSFILSIKKKSNMQYSNN